MAGKRVTNPRGCPQNMRPVRTHEEAVERGRRGGLAAQRKGIETRELKELAKTVLSCPVRGEPAQVLEAMGIEETERNVKIAILAALATRAIETGDPKAAETLFRYSGEEPHTIIEREKIKLEREKFAFYQQQNALPEASEEAEDDVVIYLPAIEAEESGE